MKILVPIRTVSEANSHTHWRARQGRAKHQRTVTKIYTTMLWRQPLPVRITLTRLAPKTLDTDNLAISMKAVRDGIADSFGVDDGDPRYDWQYAQRKSKEYGVEIIIEGKA